MPHQPTRRSVLRWLADCLFLPLAIAYTFAAAAFGCSGSVSVSTGGSNTDPNRALGTFSTSVLFTESASSVFFGYWLDGDSGINPVDGQALQQSIGVIRCRATVAIVPTSILYEETATEISSGNSITVSIPGTWSYDAARRIKVNWGAAIVTASTFPTFPPFTVAAVGTQIQRPQPGDLVFANSPWNELTNVGPGPLDGIFLRGN